MIFLRCVVGWDGFKRDIYVGKRGLVGKRQMRGWEDGKMRIYTEYIDADSRFWGV
jgi:hypothetical protein